VVRVRLGALTQIFELKVPEETLNLRDRQISEVNHLEAAIGHHC